VPTGVASVRFLLTIPLPGMTSAFIDPSGPVMLTVQRAGRGMSARMSARTT